VLRWVGAVAAVLILAAAFSIWRLMQGPIELNWLAPYVEAGLLRSGIEFKIALSGVRIGIDGASHQLELRADDVRLSRPDGTPLARFPEMAAGFALGALLHGRLEPTALVIERPVLHLSRGAGGAISAQIGGDRASDLGPRALERLAGPPRPDAPLALLHRISIRDATVFVHDRSSGRTWRADRVDVAIDRDRKGTRGDVSFALPLGDTMPELHASYRFRAERQLLDLDLAIDGVKPDALPPLIPELAGLRHIAAPVSGTLQTQIDLQRGRPQGSRLDLALGKGHIYSGWLPMGGVRVEQGELHATYAPENDALRLASLNIDLGGGTRLSLHGIVNGVTPALVAGQAGKPQPHLTGRFAAALTHVPVARFAALWSPAFYPGARTWALENIRDGMLDEGGLSMTLDLDTVAHTARVVTADGRLHYHGLSVTYLRGLPPVRDVAGTATFAGDKLVFTPTGGDLKGLKIAAGGSLTISDLAQHTQWMTIDLGVVGPVRDALQVIDSRPLRYAQKIGLDSERVGGRGETRLHFRFPLLADLKLAAIDYGAEATLTDISIPDLALGHGIRVGRFALDLDRTGARLRGTGLFADIPARLQADVPFNTASGAHAVFRVGLTLDAAAQQRLGLDIAPDRLNGPIAIDATYSPAAAHSGQAVALLDLRDAALSVPEAGWEKAAGQPGSARIVLDLADQKIAGIPQIIVTAAGLNGRLSAALSPDGKSIALIAINRLTIGGDDLSGTVTRRADGGWRADIYAPRADASHLLQSATAADPASDSPPLDVNFRIDRLSFGGARELRQVGGRLLRVGGVWQSGQVAGQFPDGHKLALQFGDGGGRKLVLQSDDLGDTLRLLDIADNVVGGKLQLDGQLSQVGAQRVLRAHLDGSNYVVNRTPILARLLALPSLTGLASTLSGSGLPFIELRGDISYGGGRLTLQRLLAYGESLGITAKGWVDIAGDRLGLQGTVAPAYALNSIVGHVPIIGPLFGGGSQGLFAAEYRISGAGADPQVWVNPLSALAPGFLRQLFDPFADAPGASPPAAD